MRQLVLGRPPWQFWIEGGIGPRDASTTPIGPQRTAHLAAVEKTCTPSEIKEVNSCYSLCLKKLFVTNSEKKKTIFKYGMPTTRQQGWQFFVEPKQFQITHWFWPTTLKSICYKRMPNSKKESNISKEKTRFFKEQANGYIWRYRRFSKTEKRCVFYDDQRIKRLKLLFWNLIWDHCREEEVKLDRVGCQTFANLTENFE